MGGFLCLQCAGEMQGFTGERFPIRGNAQKGFAVLRTAGRPQASLCRFMAKMFDAPFDHLSLPPPFAA